LTQIPATGRGGCREGQCRRLSVRLAAVGAALTILSTPACRRKEVVASFPDSYAGVGLELRIEGDAPVVVRSLIGGAGEQAGILAGDRVLAVDGATTKGQSLGDVVMKLRGAPESQVTLTLDRKGQKLIVAMRRSKMVKQRADYSATP
jgi:C-terminal processing protease CtpA/Prc